MYVFFKTGHTSEKLQIIDINELGIDGLHFIHNVQK